MEKNRSDRTGKGKAMTRQALIVKQRKGNEQIGMAMQGICDDR